MKNYVAGRAGGAGHDLVSHCFCLRGMVRVVARVARVVIAQVLDFIAGGKTDLRAHVCLSLQDIRGASLGVGAPRFVKLENAGWSSKVAGTAIFGGRTTGQESRAGSAGVALPFSWSARCEPRLTAMQRKWRFGQTPMQLIGAASSRPSNPHHYGIEPNHCRGYRDMGMGATEHIGGSAWVSEDEGKYHERNMPASRQAPWPA